MISRRILILILILRGWILSGQIQVSYPVEFDPGCQTEKNEGHPNVSHKRISTRSALVLGDNNLLTSDPGGLTREASEVKLIKRSCLNNALGNHATSTNTQPSPTQIS